MRIGMRISAGFAVVVALSAMVGIVGWVSLSSVIHAAGVARQAGDLLMTVKALHADIACFAQEGDDAQAEAIRSALRAAADQTDRLIAATTWTPDDAQAARAEIGSVGRSFAALEDSIRRNAATLDQVTGRTEEIVARAETLQRTHGQIPALKDDVFSLRLGLSSLAGVELALRAGRIEDATDGLMAAQRAILTAGMRMKQGGDERLAGAVTAVTEAMQGYRTDFEGIRAAAIARRQSGEEIRAAADRLEMLLTQAVEQERHNMDGVVRNANGMLMLGMLLGVLAGAALASMLGRGIVRPIRDLTDSMQRLAEGDIDSQIPGQERRDEMGAMAAAVEVFRHNAHEVRRLQAERASHDRRLKDERRQVHQRLADEIRASLGSVAEAIGAAAAQLERSARALSDSATQTSRQAAEVGDAARLALAGVEAVDAATGALSASAAEIGHQVHESSSIAHQAVDETRRTDTSMASLSRAAENISGVAALIGAIAAQTKLLALNATIEAARAGEAGKGFVVVADEVKTLAGQTDRATGDITHQIEEIQDKTSGAARALGTVSTIIDRMDGIARAVAATVERQTAATREIVARLAQAAQGTRAVTAGIDGFAAAAGLTGREAATVLDAAAGLARDATDLRSALDALVVRICQDD